MDYNKINKLFKNGDFAKMDFYRKIGITATGFRQMMDNKSLKVETLEKIAEFFGVPVISFFPNTGGEGLSMPVELHPDHLKLLQENSSLKDEIIRLQRKFVDAQESPIIPEHKPKVKLEKKH